MHCVQCTYLEYKRGPERTCTCASCLATHIHKHIPSSTCFSKNKLIMSVHPIKIWYHNGWYWRYTTAQYRYMETRRRLTLRPDFVVSLASLRMLAVRSFGVQSFYIVGYTDTGRYFHIQKERHLFNAVRYCTSGVLHIQVVRCSPTRRLASRHAQNLVVRRTGCACGCRCAVCWRWGKRMKRIAHMALDPGVIYIFILSSMAEKPKVFWQPEVSALCMHNSIAARRSKAYEEYLVYFLLYL